MEAKWYGPAGDGKKAEVKPTVAPMQGDAKKPAEAQPAKSDTPAPVVVPEKYNLQLGDAVVVDQAMVDEFSSWAKARRLTNEQAQEAANLHLKSVQAIERQRTEALEDQKFAWHDEIVNDRDLGGDRLDATMAAAKQTFTNLVSQTPGINAKRLGEDLARTGLATHPDIIRLFHQLSRMLK